MKKITFNEFKKFLEFLGLWEKYKCGLRKDEMTVTRVRKYDAKYYISNSFAWSKTDEKYEFWNAVDCMWNAYIELKEIEARKAIQTEVTK